jgi:hypothetical protein
MLETIARVLEPKGRVIARGSVTEGEDVRVGRPGSRMVPTGGSHELVHDASHVVTSASTTRDTRRRPNESFGAEDL